MLPEYRDDYTRFRITPDELREIFKQRLRTLDEAAREPLSGDPLPVQWRTGFKAFWRPLRRDRDGNLMVLYWVTGPSIYGRYERKVRHVQRKPLPLSLGLE